MSALLTLLAEAKRDAGQSPVAAVVFASRGSGAFRSQTNRFVLMGLTYCGVTDTRISLVIPGYIPKAHGLTLNKITLLTY
jgi:hypothetical protein